MSYTPLKVAKSLSVVLILLLTTKGNALAQTSNTDTALLVKGSYFDILREGITSFQIRGEGAAAGVKLGAAAARIFRDALVESKIDEELQSLRGDMETALKVHPHWGILLEVRRFVTPSGPAYIQGGGPIIIGFGPSPADAAADFIADPPLLPSPPVGMLRSNSSYMIWGVLDEHGKLQLRTIPLVEQVWRDGDSEHRRRLISRSIARQHVHLLRIAEAHNAYSEAAKHAERASIDAGIKAQILALEARRQKSFEELVSAMAEYETASRRASSRAWLVNIGQALELVSFGLQAAEKLTSAPVTEIDGAPRAETDSMQNFTSEAQNSARATYESYEMVEREVRTKSGTWREVTNTIRSLHIENATIDSPQSLPEPPDALPSGIRLP